VICPSSEVSGTVRSAEVAAKDFPGADIHIVDTRSIGSGLGVIVKKACEWAEEGLDVETITAKVLEMASREKILFLVDTLEYLQKGGRIGKAQALFGSLLQVKPILTLKDGHTEPVESQRTKRRAMARLCELVEQSCPTSSEAHITVMEGDAVEEANYLVGYFKKCLRVSEIPVFFLPPAILVHAGPGAVAVSFFTS
jgi:DegV family protein with EDD domain